MPGNAKLTKVNDLSQLLSLVAQDEEGLQEYIYPNLQVGDMWWIPDIVTQLPKKEHPWVIVKAYSPGRPTVIACLRTTSFDPLRPRGGLVTPAGVLPGLNSDGLLLLDMRRTLIAASFSDYGYRYIGRLSDAWIDQIRNFNSHRAEGKLGK